MNRTLLVRSRTALFFGLVMLSFLLFSKESNLVLIALIFALCTWEYLSLNPVITRVTKMAGVASVMVMTIIPVALSLGRPWILGISVLALLYQVIIIYQLYIQGKSKRSHNLLSALFYLGLTGFLASQLINSSPFETRLLLTIFIIIWVSDSAAYLVGSNIGKRKLFPSISPNKSIEGFLGAGVFSILVIIIYTFYTGQSDIAFWVLFAIIIWIMGTYGDLIESGVKRQYDIKDSGNILPGHGGFLDRFDSFIFIWPCMVLLHLVYN